jgi:phage terminase small subunit
MDEKPSSPKRKVNLDSERFEIFAQEYCKDFNATRAAIAAGYSKNGAQVKGSNLLSNVIVKQRIKDITSKRTSKLEITGERILAELAKIAFINDSYDPGMGTMEFRAGDKVKALELLGKWHEMGLWKETLEVKRAPEERSDEFKQLLGQVRLLYGSIKLERGK